MSGLITNHWKIIFTTRYGYLDDLKFQFIEVYRIAFQSLMIEKLSVPELSSLSETYQFDLPENPKLFSLIQIPFYLNEYLSNYELLKNTASYSDFKRILWNKTISKTNYCQNNIHIKREKCFMEIAHKRAIYGNVFVRIENLDEDALRGLMADEIIKYDSTSGGYFITQDIYEEWALDRIIEKHYLSLENVCFFFQNIGNSLPIRRAFRLWLSEKLNYDIESVRDLIETTINNENIEACWKDEVYISIQYCPVISQINTIGYVYRSLKSC